MFKGDYMKKMAILFSALIALGGTASVSMQSDYSLNAAAAQTVEDGAITYEVYDDYAVVKKYNFLTGVFLGAGMKSKINGVPVTEIGDQAFFMSQISSVKLPDSITKINGSIFAGAFMGSSIEEIDIPESVESIGHYAFAACSSLKSITINNPYCDIYDDPDTIATGSEGFSGTIYGYRNSTAHDYAEKYGYNFVPLDPESETEPETELETSEVASEIETAESVESSEENSSPVTEEGNTEINESSEEVTSQAKTETVSENVSQTTTSASNTVSANNSKSNSDSPQTGDKAIPVGIAALASSALAVAFITKKRNN